MTTVDADHNKVISAIEAFLGDAAIKPNIDRLRQCFPPTAELLVAGGAIRNTIIELIHGKAPPTADIDLFVGGVTKDYPLEKYLAGENIRKTDLGGLRWLPPSGTYSYDISLLPNFIIIAKYKLAPTIDALLNSIDFTVNAAIYDVACKKFLEHGCLVAIKNRLIEFNTERMVSKLMLAYRIFLIRHKTGFLLSQRVFTFLKNQIDLTLLNDLKMLFIVKQGQRKAEDIISDFDHICRFHTYDEYIRQSHREILP
jgi:hypothetical protein